MASRESMDTGDLIGRVVDGRYKIIEGMASGSMGAVFKAERIPVGKQVAIKFLHAAFANDSEFKIRFERETRVMSKLNHPNCVSVVDFGMFDASPYLVMDYVAGRTLRSVIDEAPLGPIRALTLARQIAAGLAHAHSQDVIHRDIKPANIMISQEIGTGERIRLLDFGLARLRVNNERDATQINMVVGTPNYMAPEQTVGGGRIDARTDIYAVGVLLFEMIAGERPFSAEDTLQLLGMHRAAPIPQLADRLDRTIVIPDGLQALIEKAMAKVPDDRFQTAIELADAIDEITGVNKTPPPPGQVARRRVPTPVAGVAANRSDAAVASTMIDTTTDKAKLPPPTSSTKTGMIFAVLLLLGGAAAAWYMFGRGNKDHRIAIGSGTGSAGSAVGVGTGSGSSEVGSGSSEVGSGSSEVGSGSGSAITDVGSGSGSADVGSGSGSGTTVGSGSDVSSGSGSAASGSGSGSGSGAGSGSGSIEMDPDPAAAENLAPKVEDKEDEASDAPATSDEVEKKTPPAPVQATTIHDAVLLIKEGKTELAITSLRAIWKTNGNSAYVPFLLGNLYYDKGWWSIAMDHYKIAIIKNGGYRANPVLNRNIIKTLAGTKTRAKASAMLRGNGKFAMPYLKQATATNNAVGKAAANLYRTMGGR